eukprot:558249-Alexandrium_andersonii.AAC.1
MAGSGRGPLGPARGPSCGAPGRAGSEQPTWAGRTVTTAAETSLGVAAGVGPAASGAAAGVALRPSAPATTTA